jgi:hypothetical protein
MTNAPFEYEEPEVTSTTSTTNPSLAADPAADAMAMINNGPDVSVAVDAGTEGSQEANTESTEDTAVYAEFEVVGEIDQPGDEATTTVTSDEYYSDEEYAELRCLAEEDHALELQRLQTEHAEASVERSLVEDQLKGLKKKEKLLLEMIREHQADGADYPDKKKPKAVITTVGDADADSQEGNSSPGSLSPHSDVAYADPNNLVGDNPEHEAYYSTPTASLLAGIDGLGKAKLETLIEVAPTCRDLQRLNIEAGRYHHGDISELLPKGFGKALGERIINRLLDKMPFVAPKSTAVTATATHSPAPLMESPDCDAFDPSVFKDAS